MFENPGRGRQARNFTTNAPKILDLKSSSEQIFSRKLPLGAPENSFVVVSLRQKRPPSGEERGEKLVAIFEKTKKCKGSNFVAQKTSAYIIFFRPHRVIN